MTEVPIAAPYTKPDEEPIVALELLLVHVPPPALVNGVVNPIHTCVAPLIGAGNGFIVTVFIARHPVGGVKVITEVPAETPVTMPVPAPTVAFALLLLHVPGPKSANTVVRPSHTTAIPVMGDGSEFTVTTVVVMQPVLKV